MIYQNAEENATEVQKALFLWRKAMDKVRPARELCLGWR